MEHTSSALGRMGELFGFTAKWVIWFTRKFPLAGAAYLGFYIWFFFLRTDIPAPPPPPVPQSPGYPARSPSESLPSTVQPVAQVQAFRDGDQVLIRWSSAVQSQRLTADGQRLDAKCQPQSCAAVLPADTQKVEARWKEANQSFTKAFRF